MMPHRLSFLSVLLLLILTVFTETTQAETKPDMMLESTMQNDSEPQAQKLKSTDMEKPRGQLLYETHCGACHESSVHSRNPRKATSKDEIKKWVTRWSTELKLNWSSSDINDVAGFVNNRYYHFEK